MNNMTFDPKTNEDDKAILNDMVHSIIKKIADKYMGSNVIKINDKEYHFKGINTWVEVYIKWFDRKKKELNDKIAGYTKSNRWDDVGNKMIKFQGLSIEDQDKTRKDFVDDLLKVMVEQEKTPLEPEDVAKELDVIYKSIHDNVFRRLFQDDIEQEDIPAVWDGFIRYIASQQEAATNFYYLSTDMSTLIYETGQEMKALLPANS